MSKFLFIRVSNKNGLNKSLSRHVDVGILIVVMLLFGFYGQFVIINQSQATIVKDTLNLPSSSIDNTNRSIRTNNNNIIQSFHVAYETLINDSHSLTQSYQKEMANGNQNNMTTRQ